MQNGGHLQSNTSISETKRRRAFNFGSMSRFCGAWISEKVLPNTPGHCIHHFEGDLKKMAAISKVVPLSEKLRDTDPSIYHVLVLWGVDLKKKYCVVYVGTRYQPF